MITRYDKAFIAALLTVIFWVVTSIQTGDWTNFEVVKGALTTLLVYLVPNTGTDGEL